MTVVSTAERRFWSKVALPDENGCMLWLAGKFTCGYGRIRTGDSSVNAHRFSLALAEGEPADAGMNAAHSCRRRDCVAPLHLRWATPVENEADKIRDGVSNRGERCATAKLTREQVLEIRARQAKGGVSQQALAAEYGISRSHVSGILSGTAWSWLTDAGVKS